jgi:uncharacterized protein (DUF4415 family)
MMYRSHSMLDHSSNIHIDAQAAPWVASAPGLREHVVLDPEVLAHFQGEGPGWQERINEVLRAAARLRQRGPVDEGLRPDQLTCENDG